MRLIAPQSFLALAWASCIVVLGAGCQIDATNAFDPDAPPELQAKATLVGRVVVPGRDLDARPVALSVFANGERFELDGAPLVVHTRTAADGFPAGIDDDGAGAAGTFAVALPPGSYTIAFEAARNDEPLLEDVESRAVSLLAGEIERVSLRVPAKDVSSAPGAVVGSVEGVEAGLGARARLVPDAPLAGFSERSVAIGSDGRFSFGQVPAAVPFRVLVEGEQYAPATSAPFTLDESHSAAAPLELAPIRLLTLGGLFAVDHVALGAEPPYVSSASVPLEAVGAVLLAGEELAGLDHVEVRGFTSAVLAAVRAGEAAGEIDDGGWRPLASGGLTLALDEAPAPLAPPAVNDGPVTLALQLRLCFQADCACADETCRAPVVSGAIELGVVLDRAPPTLVEASVDGERSSEPEGPALVLACATFGSSDCTGLEDAAADLPFTLRVVDEVGRVRGFAAALDGDTPALSVVSAAPGFTTLSGRTPPFSAEDGAGELVFLVEDAAGNRAELHQRSYRVDVTPLVFAEPPLALEGTQTFDVDGVEAEIIPGSFVSIDVVTDEPPARWRVKNDEGPLLGGPETQALSPYLGAPAVALVTGAHRDQVTLVVSVEDDAGNVSEAPPRFLRVWRTGRVRVAAALEDGGGAGAVTAVLAGESGTPLAGVNDGTGAITFDEVLSGVYTLTLSAPGYRDETRTGVSVAPALETSLGAITLLRPRGGLTGRVLLDDEEDPLGHGGVVVQVKRGALQVATANTLADGSWTASDLLAGTGYQVVASKEGYLPAVRDGLEVVGDAVSVVDPDGAGDPVPMVLSALAGDFRLCAVPADGRLDPACEPLLYTSLGELAVGTELSGFSEYRIVAARGDPADPFPDPDDGWTAIATDGDDILAPTVAIGGDGEGRYTVVFELRTAPEATPESLRATVVVDRTPPAGAALTLAKGASALVEGFTRDSVVQATWTADAGSGEVAPLGTGFVTFADAPPATPPAATACSVGVPCAVPLAEVVEGVHTAYAFACDLARNCSASPVSARIVRDVTPPSALSGAALAPESPDITPAEGGRFFTRSVDYAVRVSAGSAVDGEGGAVLDVEGAPVADVLAIRLGVAPAPAAGNGSYAFGAAPFTALSAAAGGEEVLTGPALPRSEARYRVYAQLVDAAGNTSPLADNPHHFDLVFDETAPSVLFRLNDGAAVTADPSLALGVIDSGADPAVRVELDVDDAAFDEADVRPLPLSGAAAVLDLGAGAADGLYTVSARFSDAAGNTTIKNASIRLDRTPPSPPVPAAPLPGDLVVSATPTFVWAPSPDAATYRVEILQGGSVVRGPTEVVSTSHSESVPLADGTFSWRVRAYDAVGNASALDPLLPAPFHVDTSAPAGLANLRVVGGSPTADPTPTLAWDAATDPHGVRYVVELSSDAGFGSVSSAGPLSDTSWRPASALGDGIWYWRVRARDDAGNEALVTGPSFVIDTVAPAAPILTTLPSPTRSLDGISWGAVAGAHRYRLIVQQVASQDAGTCGSFTRIDQETEQTSVDVAVPSTPGCHYRVSVAARDELDNESAADSQVVLVDTVAPAPVAPALVIGNASSAVTSTRDVSLALSATGSPTSVRLVTYERPSCASAPTPVAADFDAADDIPFAPIVVYRLPENASSSNEGPPPSDQCKYVAAVFLDAAGNRSAPSAAVMDAVLLDDVRPDAPALLTTPMSTSSNTVTLELERNARDHNLVGYEIRSPREGYAQKAPDNATCLTNPAVGCLFTFTSLPAGKHVFAVRAVDAAGQRSDEDTVTIEVDPNAPPPPPNLVIRPGDGRLDLSWGSSKGDAAGYRVHYGIIPDASGGGNACSPDPTDYKGTYAAQGASGFDVGLSTIAALTNLPNGVALCVGVTAYDDTEVPGPNESAVTFVEATAWRVAPALAQSAALSDLDIRTGERAAIAYRDGYLYIASDAGLSEVDVSNEGCFSLPGDLPRCFGVATSAAGLNAPRDLVLAGSLAFVADSDGVAIFNVDASPPAHLQTLPIGDARSLDVGPPYLLGVTFHDGNTRGVRFYDLRPLYTSPPAAPTVLKTFSTDGSPEQSVGTIDINGPHALVAMPKMDVLAGVYDLSNPASIDQIGRGLGEAHGIVKSGRFFGQRAFVGTTDGQLVYDAHLDVHADPVLAPFTSIGTDGESVLEPAGPYLFTLGERGVAVIDTRDVPQLVGRYERDLTDGDMAVVGNRVYVVTGGAKPELLVLHVGSLSAAEASFSKALGQTTDFIPWGLELFSDQREHLQPREDTVEVMDTIPGAFPSMLTREGDVVLGALVSGTEMSTYRRNASVNNGYPEVHQTHAMTAGRRVRSIVLRWPYALLHVEKWSPPIQNELQVVDLTQSPPVVLFTATLGGTQTYLQNGHAGRLVAHKGYAYVALRSGIGTGEATDGIWRVAFDGRTGKLGAVTQVFAGGHLTRIETHGRRLFALDRVDGLLLHPLGTPGSWDPRGPYTLNAAAPAISSTMTALGDELLVASPDLDTSQTRVLSVVYDESSHTPVTAPFVSFYGTINPRRAVPLGDALFVANGNGIMQVFRLR